VLGLNNNKFCNIKKLVFVALHVKSVYHTCTCMMYVTMASHSLDGSIVYIFALRKDISKPAHAYMYIRTQAAQSLCTQPIEMVHWSCTSALWNSLVVLVVLTYRYDAHCIISYILHCSLCSVKRGTPYSCTQSMPSNICSENWNTTWLCMTRMVTSDMNMNMIHLHVDVYMYLLDFANTTRHTYNHYFHWNYQYVKLINEVLDILLKVIIVLPLPASFFILRIKGQIWYFSLVLHVMYLLKKEE